MAHAITCAELISLLYLLHSVPAVPSSNPLPEAAKHNNGYSISFERERKLVGTLAFLSSAKDDPNHVPALCIQEQPESAALTVLLAVNKLNSNDGNQILQELKEGFEKIFKLLSQVSEVEIESNVEAEIFSVIVSMCSYRILRRLRFLPNTRKIQGQPIKEVLQTVIDSIKQLGEVRLGNLLPLSVLFTERVKATMKLADAWVKHQTVVQLRSLVESIYHLKQLGGIRSLFHIMPNKVLNPSIKTNLLNIVNKVARYREASRYLYRAAKRIRSMRNMRIVIVGLPEKTFGRLAIDSYTPRLASTFTGINMPNRRKDLGRICHLMKSDESQAGAQFATQTKRTLKEAKIHAEIQLFYYLQLHPSKLPPRVICSSKDACFLCNAFLLLHGKIHIPRCHGRLYPGWRLPLLENFDDIEKRFNVVLKNQVQKSLDNLFMRGQKTIYPDPNESTLLTLTPSTLTLRDVSPLSRSIATEDEPIPTQPDEEIVTEAESLVLINTEVLSISSNELSTFSSLAGTEEEIDIQKSNCGAIKSPSQSPSNHEEALFKITSASKNLIRGRALVNQSTKIHQSSHYITEGLEVFVEKLTESIPERSECPSKEIDYSIEWLKAETVNNLDSRDIASIIDVEAMQGESLQVVDERNGVLIAGGGTVVKICLY